jgi:hypothetical protein
MKTLHALSVHSLILCLLPLTGCFSAKSAPSGQIDGGSHLDAVPEDLHADHGGDAMAVDATSGDGQGVVCESTFVSDEVRLLAAAWDKLNAEVNGGLWYANEDNRATAVLGNSQDLVMQAYLDMYRATDNRCYLDTLLSLVSMALTKRDDRTGFTDYSGQSNPVWSTLDPNYVTDGKAYPFLVESGNITYPMADLAQLIINDATLHHIEHGSGRTYLDLAQQLVSEVEQTVDFHHQTWHTDTQSGIPIGFYTSLADASGREGIAPDKPVPVNYMSSMGRTLICMHLATGQASYLERAKRLAGFLLLELEYQTESDGYVWYYWPKMSYYPPGTVDNGGNDDVEDLSHAALSVELAALAHAHAGVFYQTEMQWLANTFTEQLHDGATGQLSWLVDGSGPAATPAQLTMLGHYLMLAPFDSSIGPIIRSTLIDELGLDQSLGGAAGLRSLALLIRYLNDRM